MFQFATLTDTPYEQFSVNRDRGFQQTNGRVSQQIEGLFGRQKQPLEFADGELFRVALDLEGLITLQSAEARFGRSVSDGRGKRMSCEGRRFGVDADQCSLLKGEGVAGRIDSGLEVTIGLRRLEKTLPEKAIALSRQLASVPVPKFIESNRGVYGYPVDQGPCWTEGVGQLTPNQYDVQRSGPPRVG